MTPAELSTDLRTGNSPFLQKRRTAVALTLSSIGALGVIALYQMGTLKHVPEPPWPGLDADKVNGSAQAYQYFSTPDALLGIGSYAATACLIAMGSQDRWRARRWIPLAAAGKALFDAAVAGKLAWDEATKYRAFCLWCLWTTAATFGTLALTLPEAEAACGRRG